MRRLSTAHPFTCVTCEVEIAGPPTFHVGLPFCCAGCVADGPCICTYDEVEPEPADLSVRHCLDLGEFLPGRVDSTEPQTVTGRRTGPPSGADSLAPVRS
jgi:hypothetical protein